MATALTTLVLGKDYKFDGRGALGLAIALGCFLIAAGLSLLALRPMPYGIAEGSTLKRMTGEGWRDPDSYARQALAYLKKETICSMRAGNNLKATFLIAAHSVQMLAVAALIATLGHELWRTL
ncbi:MAG TPA: hypothetical protein VNA30_04010 [Mycobacteriales bacterium]|nr:hypothetical protein [Mycobacteriales bacterium]